jgi:hypothetical protein
LSTRGCVAVKTGTGWRGVYNHSDSYPTGLGKELWEHLKGKDLKKFAEELLRFDDWRNYLAGGVCPYCGRRGLSQPHSIGGGISGREPGGAASCFGDARFKTKREMREYYRGLPGWRGRNYEIEREIEHEWEIRRNIRRTGFPDPAVKYHKHGPLDPSHQHIVSEDPDPLFIEWVYVVNPEKRELEVLAHQGIPSDGPVALKPVPSREGYFDYGHCKYRHVRIARFSLDGPEPDWEQIETLGRICISLDCEEEEELVFRQLKEGRINRTTCVICCGEALGYPGKDVAHLSCLRSRLEELGGDAQAWIGGLRREYCG